MHLGFACLGLALMTALSGSRTTASLSAQESPQTLSEVHLEEESASYEVALARAVTSSKAAARVTAWRHVRGDRMIASGVKIALGYQIDAAMFNEQWDGAPRVTSGTSFQLALPLYLQAGHFVRWKQVLRALKDAQFDKPAEVIASRVLTATLPWSPGETTQVQISRRESGWLIRGGDKFSAELDPEIFEKLLQQASASLEALQVAPVSTRVK
jgi:hypothetical protein